MRITRLSQLVALLAWMSTFVCAWLLVLRRVPSDLVTWILLAAFTFIATTASLIAATPPSKTR